MNTIWENDVRMPAFGSLQGNVRTDVLIIGGGLAGLLCAQSLTRAGIDCMLIEENRLMSGVSGRTTAKLTSQHGLVYDKILRRYGAEKALLYWEANEDAIATFCALVEEIDCDFERKDHYLFTTGDIQKLEREAEAYEKLGIPAKWCSQLALPFPVTGALCFTNQAQFHPLKFAAHIAKNLKVYEDTKALAFDGKCVQTPNGKITAEKIIVATHFPMFNKHGGYFLKLYQQRSYVLALDTGAEIDGMYLEDKENGLSLRSAGNYLLLGGGGHRTGMRGRCWDLPEDVAKKYYPKAKEVARWATQDCMSLDAIPYIGQYSKATPDLYVATGFHKWGMSSSMVAAMILTDMVQGRENPYGQVFAPSRTVLHRQTVVNGVEAAANLLCLRKPRCPHLGCALKWNDREHSWDCPCHGSRFDENGKRRDGPASGDLPEQKQ